MQHHQANTVPLSNSNRIMVLEVAAAVVVSVAAEALVALKEDKEDLKVDTHHHQDLDKVIKLNFSIFIPTIFLF